MKSVLFAGCAACAAVWGAEASVATVDFSKDVGKVNPAFFVEFK